MHFLSLTPPGSAAPTTSRKPLPVEHTALIWRILLGVLCVVLQTGRRMDQGEKRTEIDIWEPYVRRFCDTSPPVRYTLCVYDAAYREGCVCITETLEQG